MKRLLLLIALSVALVAFYGCSDDDDGPTGPGDGGTTSSFDTTMYDASTGVYTTRRDASSYETAATFSFADAAQPSPAAMPAEWDLSFQRTVINLNGGASGAGNVLGADLGAAKAFADVSIADTAGLTWEADTARFIVDSFLTYNPVTHQLDMTQYVYSMVDAEADNYVKFRIDSIVGAQQPPNMGTVWISYYYQPAAGNTDLSGTVQTASITVGSGTGYFDFSSGQAVTPSNPTTSTDWDLAIANYNVMMNCGPNGPGECAGFPAYTELVDPTNIEGLTANPPGAQMFPDFVGSVFNGSLTDNTELWYDYNPQNHSLSSKSHVYLINVGGAAFYALEITSYYADIEGSLESGYYTFIWKQL